MSNASLEDKIDIMLSYQEGESIQQRRIKFLEPFPVFYNWEDCANPEWNWQHYQYRIAPTAPSINWTHVATQYKYMARDEDGTVWLYINEPECSEEDGSWFVPDSEVAYAFGDTILASTFISMEPGTCDWKDSLVCRYSNGWPLLRWAI